MVRAKMRCTEKTSRTSASNYGEAKPVDTEEITLRPVVGPGNEAWSRWTPSGEVKLTINNPAAVAQFEVGKDYFVDFTPAEAGTVTAG
jgi:hypothetical protein